MSYPLLITVLGPTASGKTSFAAGLARCLDGEVISADSRQVYRGMDQGTGKDYSDYIIDGIAVPYHLIDIVDAGYRYSVYEFQRDFINAWKDIAVRGRQAILCGGSGMYIEAVTDSYKLIEVPEDRLLREKLESMSDDELQKKLSSLTKVHNVSDTSSRDRLIRAIEIAAHTKGNEDSNLFPRFENLLFGLGNDRDQRRRRITARLDERLKAGLIDEVKLLLDGGLTPEELIYYGLEYKYITLYLTGSLSYTEMREKLNIAIHQFAKRQMTWFRKMERNGYGINWLDMKMSYDEKLQAALSVITRYAGNKQ